MPKSTKASKTKTRTRVENLPARKQKMTSKDMKKVKGGVVAGNLIGTDHRGALELNDLYVKKTR